MKTPAKVPGTEPTAKPLWFLATIYRIPTSFAKPEVVAIQAFDWAAASDRIYKLYGQTHAASSGRSLDDALGKHPAESSDEIEMARKHPLPIAL